ncbi:TetR family transcriptional regulator [Xanthomonas floridensis]|uniref:TetR family transcriptional regulator n=1 Tax=Xanthomonas floridensis TaxID=1843580 RepID=A0A1A9MAP9_9XANT|nr:TetR family transcriptional regulator [Xanthomonas floridensis]
MVTKQQPSPVRPRKVPRQSRAAYTVAMLLEAVACLLESEGTERLSTNRVAQRAGVSIGSLYQYFPSKDALIVALCQRERGAFLTEAQAAQQATDGRGALVQLISAAVRQQLHRPTLARLLDYEQTRPVIASELAPFIVAMTALVGQLLARADVPTQPDPTKAIDDVIAIVRGMVNTAGDRGEHDHAGLEQRIGRAVFGYLGMPPAGPQDPRTTGASPV